MVNVYSTRNSALARLEIALVNKNGLCCVKDHQNIQLISQQQFCVFTLLTHAQFYVCSTYMYILAVEVLYTIVPDHSSLSEGTPTPG